MGSSTHGEPGQDSGKSYEICPMQDHGDNYKSNFDSVEKGVQEPIVVQNGGAAPNAYDGQKAAAWKTVWYEFSQSTTLHGVNKITEETPFNIRR